eukprot:m.96349 g.96349  ORF g.96349 m.96349 type:complete len:439 (-) comp20463_c1_seq2:2438-3754(-)
MGAQLTWFNETYLTVRLILWTLVALASLIDWLTHRNDKPRGWQLHRVISIVLLVYVVQEAATTAFVTIDGSDALYSFLIFIYNLASSLFLGVLLVISCGWQITRDSFQKRRFIFFFPPIHFACSVTVDYILDSHIGHSDAKDEVAYIPDSGERTVLIAAYFGSIVTVFYGWWWIFTCLAIERTEIQKKIERGSPNPSGEGYDDDDDDSDRSDYEDRTRANADLADTGAHVDNGNFNGEGGAPPARARLTSVNLGSDADEEEEVVFQAPPEAAARDQRHRRRTRAERRADRSRTRAGQLGVTLIESARNDEMGSPESTSVDHSSMPDRAKLRMLTQYGIMVQIYLFIILIVLLVNAWRQDRTIASVVLVEMLNLIFLAGLLYTFRLRSTNPYYMLEEHDYHDDTYGAPVDAVPAGGSRPIEMRTHAFEIGGDSDECEEV